MASGDTGGEDYAAAVAALELTLVSVLGIKEAAPEEKRCHIFAWVDPCLRQRVRADRIRKTTPRLLYFPLHRRTLDDTNSCVTIEVIYSPWIPFHRRRLVGSGVLPLSSVPVAAGRAAEAVVLPIETPSGKFRGVVMVSARILWDLGSGAGACGFPPAEDLNGMDLPNLPPLLSAEAMQPTAPPLPEDGHLSGHGDRSRLTLAAGAAAAAAAVIVGVAFRRLNA